MFKQLGWREYLAIGLILGIFLGPVFAEKSENLKGDGALIVSGKPARGFFIKEATERFLKNTMGFIGKKDINFSLKEVNFPTQLNPLEKIQVKIPIIENNITSNFNLHIINKDFTSVETEWLWVSNNPEKITQAGVLLEGYLLEKHPVRLLYYHLNESNEIKRVALIVENREEVPLRLHMVSGLAGPGKDGLYLGHYATKSFMEATLLDEGEYVEIPPFSSKYLFVQSFGYQHILTGLVKLTLLSGKNALIYLIAEDRQSPGGARLSKVSKNQKELTRGGVFRRCQRTISKRFIIGEPTKEIRMGDKPFIRDERTHHVLKGNYGVVYKILLQIKNPTVLPQMAEVFFEPAGGIARGSFIIDGKLKETAWLSPNTSPNKEVIYSVYLEPTEEKNIEITTQPQAGSYYPVNLGFQVR
ncbi:MAG: hypothetical protein KKA19_09500 [Candidatus Margulisbacteria bacterium]|nr:hypothetical protein [Candidatus Margulisiibacteriota bacterium]